MSSDNLCPHIVSSLLVKAIANNEIDQIEEIYSHYGSHRFGQLLITEPHQGPGLPIIVAARTIGFPLDLFKVMLNCIDDPLAIKDDKGNTLLQLLALSQPEFLEEFLTGLSFAEDFSGEDRYSTADLIRYVNSMNILGHSVFDSLNEYEMFEEIEDITYFLTDWLQ